MEKNKYLKLISNTAIFAIGTFSSKLLVFFLMPIYTRALSTAEFGVVDLIVNTANFLIPIVAVCISESVIRFGLDRSLKSQSVFSTALLTLFVGYCIFIVFYPLVSLITFIKDYVWLVYLYVLCSVVKNVCAQFVRAKGMVKLFAFDGILSTATVIVFNIVFLVIFKMGIVGYVLSTILSDAFSVLFLFVVARLERFIDLSAVSKKLWKAMLLYSLPLIPNTVFFWITNLSDRFMVSYIIDTSANGLYTVAYKIPTIITALSTIFMQAWQMSAYTQQDKQEKARFYSNVFRTYSSFIFLVASGIILMIIPVTHILVDSSYFESWKYVPYLVISVVFSCFSNFLTSVYMSEKKNVMIMLTTLIGAIINVALNLLLIPKHGPMGAAFATLVSYFVVFVIRIIDSRRYIKIKFSPLKMAINTIIISIQALMLINNNGNWILAQIIMALIMCVINGPKILLEAKKLINAKKEAV